MNTSEAHGDLDFEPWPHWGQTDPSIKEAPAPAPAPVPHEPELRPPTAEELEALRQAAYEDGFAAGRGEGMLQGFAEVQAQAHQFRSLIDSLARPLALLDARVEEELVGLVTAMVRQLVRREIRTQPGVIVAAIREAVAVLPLSTREVAVKVHPEDAALVREAFLGHASEAEPGWRIVENPAIARGGCMVVTSTSEVDATVERRLAAVIRHVFGGDRLSDLRPVGAEQSELADDGLDGAGGLPVGTPDCAAGGVL